jgi:uncharacterized protein (DUF2267 family)
MPKLLEKERSGTSMQEQEQLVTSLVERRRRRREARAAGSYIQFLKRLEAVTGWDRPSAEKNAQAVLCALEHRLFGPGRSHFEAQLPGKLRELIHACERHDAIGPSKLSKDAFLQMVSEHAQLQAPDLEAAVRAIFATLRLTVTEGEVDKVAASLPKEIAAYFRPAG